MATPFSGKTFTFTQPDGTKIQVRGWGNQNYAVFETLDGYTLARNPSTGFFEIASYRTTVTSLSPRPAALALWMALEPECHPVCASTVGKTIRRA